MRAFTYLTQHRWRKLRSWNSVTFEILSTINLFASLIIKNQFWLLNVGTSPQTWCAHGKIHVFIPLVTSFQCIKHPSPGSLFSYFIHNIFKNKISDGIQISCCAFVLELGRSKFAIDQLHDFEWQKSPITPSGGLCRKVWMNFNTYATWNVPARVSGIYSNR